MLKRLKLIYALYNFLHKKQLKYNIKLYKSLGLNKKYYSSISSKDFQNIKSDFLIENFKSYDVKDSDIYKETTDVSRQSILDFEKNGYLVLKNYLSTSQVEEINAEIEKALSEKRLTFRYRNKIMFAIHKLDILKQIGTNYKLTTFLSSLLKGKAKLFQSINFLYGSEQKTHSDSIHMTTFPLAGLLGVWVALEDIGPDNGPLHYYPGSHKLPYYLNSDYDNVGNKFLIGDKDYTAYEKMIEEKIHEQNLKKEVFMAQKGDVFVWHANLFHGGEPHKDKTKTRKSMVYHYFNENSICYHEITQRPSLFVTD